MTSQSSQRTYDHAIREFIEWYCSEPRLAFNKTVVTRYRISLELRHYASTTINLRLAAVNRAVVGNELEVREEESRVAIGQALAQELQRFPLVREP